MSDPKCAICGAYAAADLTFLGASPGQRCNGCLHRTMSVHQVVVGLMGSSKDQMARELVQYIDFCMSTVELPPDRAALLLRLRAALGPA